MSEGTLREFAASRSKVRHGMLIGAMLGLFGVWAIFFAGDSVPSRTWLGALNLLLGLAIALYAWNRGLRSGTSLRIGDQGVWFQDWGVTVPWLAISEVYQTGTRLQPFVTVSIKDPDRFLATLSDGEARRLRGNHLWKSPEFRIPFSAVDAPHREILEAIEAGIRSHD